MAERRLSTPLVLAASSAMLALALVLFGTLDGEPGPALPDPTEHDPNALRVLDDTPERAAETFYDAWRRRRWEPALSVAVGAARREVLEKRSRDEAMPHDERIVAERTWEALAHAPLTFILDQAEMLEGDRTRLSGTAEYILVGRPYRRRVGFLVVPADEDGHYRVAEMELGEVLTELPPIFQGEDGT